MIDLIKGIFEDNFTDYKKTLTQLSYDKDNKESLCNNNGSLYFDYDKIAEKYYENVPATPDIIHFKDDNIIFIEFKNGKISRDSDKRKLKLKGIEGAFIVLHEIVSRELSGQAITFEQLFSVKKQYIIVYNSNKNTRTVPIRKHFTSVQIRFGLEIYKETFFKSVNTISDSVFTQKVVQIL